MARPTTTNNTYTTEQTPLIPSPLRNFFHPPRLSSFQPYHTPLLIILITFLTIPCLLLLYPTSSILPPPSSPTQALHKSSPPKGLTFVAIGDWGRKGKHHQRTLSQGLSQYLSSSTNTNEHPVDFIVSTGDNFYENGVKSVKDSQWNSSYENIYVGKGLRKLEWWSILGNHDHLGDVSAQVDYGRREGRWNMLSMYYNKVFRIGGEEVLFVFLDTTPFVKDGYGKEARKKNKQDPGKQVEWFRKVMGSSREEKIVVVLHHNMYSISIAGHFGTREVRAAIEPVLLEHRGRVLAVISGHEHLLEHLQPYGGEHSWSGFAGRFIENESLNMNVLERRRSNRRNKVRNGGVIDYFISGSGSQLDRLKTPSKHSQSIWLDCCDILPFSKKIDQPRAVFGERIHGVFVFTIAKNKFIAKAVDENGKVVYTYEKDT